MLTAALEADPRQQGRHRILAHLGQGGTADVYLAVAQGPSGFNKLVVLKALKRSLQADPEFSAMFINEARLAARLNHPNIVQTYEVVEENGVSMMVMEYLEGRPLSALLQRAKHGELTLATHLQIIADMLGGLHYAHELADYDGTPLGVVHRDATPHNIFVTFDGQVKVLDFGIAKLNVSAIETRAGMIKGKIRYMSPEQIRAKPIDRRADIYAAGVMLWQAAAGEPLWRNVPDAAILARVLNGEVPSPRSVRPDVPDELERICMKALSPDRDERHASAAELQNDIEALLVSMGQRVSSRDIGKLTSQLFADLRESMRQLVEQQLSKSASLTWTGQSVPHVFLGTGSVGSRSDTREAGSSGLGRRKPRQRRRRAAAAAGLVLLAIFAVVLVSFVRQGPKPTEVAASSTVVATEPLRAEEPRRVARVELRAHPASARLFLDGRVLPSNPHILEMPVDGIEHLLLAQAPDYVDATQHFVVTRETTLNLNLERERRERVSHNNSVRRRLAPPASGPAPKRASPRAPIASAAAERSCDAPFFIDEQGIKRVLPECL